MRAEVLVGQVADVDGSSAVAGELVGGSTADAEGRVGARDDDDFAHAARGGGVACDGGDGGDVLEGGGGAGRVDELFAEGGEAAAGGGCHGWKVVVGLGMRCDGVKIQVLLLVRRRIKEEGSTP